MTAIDPPRNQGDYPDRSIDCQQAMEPAFQLLMADMYATGWGPEETRKALWKLLAAHKMTGVENARVDAQLALVRAMERLRD